MNMMAAIGFFGEREIILPTILAGTSNSGLILKSLDDGVIFTNEGSAGKGNPTCFCQLENGEVLYGTSAGYVVNHNTGTFTQVLASKIYSINSGDGKVWCGSDNQIFQSTDNGANFTAIAGGNGVCNAIIYDLASNTAFSFSGTRIMRIYGSLSVIQVGNFTCAFNAGGGNIYAGTNDGHIWKSTDYGATWGDIYTVMIPLKLIFLVKLISGRWLFGYDWATLGWGISDDDFTSDSSGSAGSIGACTCCVQVNNSKILIGTKAGEIVKSIDDGNSWSNISGNPQQGEASINAMIIS